MMIKLWNFLEFKKLKYIKLTGFKIFEQDA